MIIGMGFVLPIIALVYSTQLILRSLRYRPRYCAPAVTPQTLSQESAFASQVKATLAPPYYPSILPIYQSYIRLTTSFCRRHRSSIKTKTSILRPDGGQVESTGGRAGNV